jgi:hypothetical protein
MHYFTKVHIILLTWKNVCLLFSKSLSHHLGIKLTKYLNSLHLV